MNSSTRVTPSGLLGSMASAAKARHGTDAAWAAASGIPRETLARLKRQPSCDLRTLAALAEAAGCVLAAVPAVSTSPGEHLPASWDREQEEGLLDLVASRSLDPAAWRARGPAFFMAGVAAMLASARGFEREPFLRLAEALHPGMSQPGVFALWLERSPLRAARFLPMARHRLGRA